jgi:hypothetical protein
VIPERNHADAAMDVAGSLLDLPDPRMDRTKKHRLDDILMIALCGVLCRAGAYEDFETIAIEREEWYRQFLTLPNGIPSHDTIYRVFCQLDHKRFAECFGRWVADWSETLGIKQVAIDGKSLRGARSNTFTAGTRNATSRSSKNRKGCRTNGLTSRPAAHQRNDPC